MSDRFTPWTGAPPAGWALPAATAQAAPLGETASAPGQRFTPWTGSVGSPQAGVASAPSSSSSGGGFDPSQILGGLKGLTGGASQINSLTGGGLSDLAGFDITPYLTGAGGVLGALTGGYGLAKGIQSGNAGQSALSGLGLAGGLSALGSTGALGGAGATAAAAAAPVLGFAALPAAIFAWMQMNDMMQHQNKVQSQLHEITTAAKNAPVVNSQIGLAGTGLDRFTNATPQTLQDIIDATEQARAGWGQMSAPYDAAGSKVSGTNIRYPSYQGLESQYAKNMPAADLAAVRAQDALARMGANIRSDRQRQSMIQGNQADPSANSGLMLDPNDPNLGAPQFMDLLRNTQVYAGLQGDPFGTQQFYNPQPWAFYHEDPSGGAGGYWEANPNAPPPVDPRYQALIDAAQPGHYEDTLRQLYTLANPNFAQSQWGQLLGAGTPA